MLSQPLFDTATLLAYSLTAGALVVAPGPGQALVLTRTLQGGTRAGLVTSAGLEAGTLVHTVAAALGLSAVLATSATAFAAVKIAGAAYLVVLGVLALRDSARARHAPAAAEGGRPAATGGRLFGHAVATGILNPKVAIFFLAFLPQFVRPERGAVLVQFITLGAVLSMLGFAWDATLSIAAGRARGRFAGSLRFAAWRERVTGIVLIALGLRLAFAQRR